MIDAHESSMNACNICKLDKAYCWEGKSIERKTQKTGTRQHKEQQHEAEQTFTNDGNAPVDNNFISFLYTCLPDFSFFTESNIVGGFK